MKKQNKTKEVQIKYKIDSDFLLSLYEKAKTLKGEERKELMDQIHFFSQHIGKWLAK